MQARRAALGCAHGDIREPVSGPPSRQGEGAGTARPRQNASLVMGVQVADGPFEPSAEARPAKPGPQDRLSGQETQAAAWLFDKVEPHQPQKALDRPSLLRLIGVEEGLGGPALLDGGQLPGEIVRAAQADV